MEEALQFHPEIGAKPEVVEVWWHDSLSRGLSATGQFVDKSGCEIRHWQSALTSFCRRWESNERWHRPVREMD